MIAAIRQLRSSFPAVVNADLLKKWSIASNNEAPVLVVLRFLNLIDEEGKKVLENAKAFNEHDDEEFASKFKSIVRAAYGDLFETWGDAAWTLEKNKLIAFFRSADSTSARVGQLQATTFLALAALAGHGTPVPAGKPTSVKAPKAVKKTANQKAETPKPVNAGSVNGTGGGDAGRISSAITLRVEINLPVTDDQSVYDSIFKSIKAHLLHA